MHRKILRSGFTLVELVVVIAIIGILSALAFVALQSSRDKASNVAVKAELAEFRSEAALFAEYNNQNFWTSNSNQVCADRSNTPNPWNLFAAASFASGGVVDTDSKCLADQNNFISVVKLKVPDAAGSTYWCVDSQGNSKGVTFASGKGLNDLVLGVIPTVCTDAVVFQ